MSDTAQGPDWWLASDGKWYPPTSRPGPAPGYGQATMVTAQPGQSPLSRTLSGWTQALFWVTLGANAVYGAILLASLSAFNDWWDAPGGGDLAALNRWFDLDDARAGWGLISIVVWLATWIVLIVWMNQAHKATTALGPGQRKWSSGWTVGGWFIPIANLIIPKMVFNEIDRIATAPRQHGQVSGTWRNQPTIGLGWAWWVLLILAGILDAGSTTMLDTEFDSLVLDPDNVRAGYVVGALAVVAWMLSAAFGALYVRRLTRRLVDLQA
jgi:hypothetical protein